MTLPASVVIVTLRTPARSHCTDDDHPPVVAEALQVMVVPRSKAGGPAGVSAESVDGAVYCRRRLPEEQVRA